jgi:23S rRNA pseudouridine2605 synthase
MRLAKYIAHAGVASRRAAEDLIREGRVTVGGEVVLDPARDVDEHSGVAFDGRPLGGPEQRVVYAVNKPLGVLSTASDPYGRPTVVSLVPGSGARLYPVGRLDADATGLILLTNDGALAHRLTHPSFEVPKTYRARVGGGPVGDVALRSLRRVRADTLEITIHEGRNRQVRRMFEAVGHPVLALQRVAFGPMKLGDLPVGGHRRLPGVQERRLRELSGGSAPAPQKRREPPSKARRTRSGGAL